MRKTKKICNKLLSIILVLGIIISSNFTINAQVQANSNTNFSKNDESLEWQLTTEYSDADQKTRGSYSTLPALLAVVKRTGNFSISVNMKNVAVEEVTNIVVKCHVAARATSGKITTRSLTPINLGGLAPGSGTSLKFTWPAPLNEPIQAEIYISGYISGQVTSGYTVIVF